MRWKGYKEDSDTWENESALLACPDVLEEFKKDNLSINDKTDEGNAAPNNRKGSKSTKKVATGKTKIDSKINEEQSNTESEEEQEKDDSVKKSKKRVLKGVTKKQGKKLKAESSSVKEKDQKSNGSDDESITDGKNYEVSTVKF